MNERLFSPGFRISTLDIAVLAGGAVGAIWAFQRYRWLGLVIAFTISHFFLFCNVLRMARPLELAWSAVFMSLAGSTITFSVPGWFPTFALSLVVTLIVALIQLRKPSYHGVAWHRFNPDLPRWWATNNLSKRIQS